MEQGPEISGVLTFPPQERVIYGRGTARKLASEIDRLGKKRAFVITGSTIATQTDLLTQIKEVLGPRLAGIFYPMSQHVPRRDVLLATSHARQAEADVLVSLGGGSPVDGTKAVALCLTERLTSEEQIDSHRLKPGGRRLSPQFPSQSIPHIAITTTLSAGEFTHIFGITDEVRRIKDGYGAPQFVPRVVILDPELTVHTPQWLWASTGLRAVDHAVERVYSVRHQPFVDTLCLQALRYLFQNLPRSVREPQDLEARLHCQLGAWMSIIGFMNVRTGISHAIGHQRT